MKTKYTILISAGIIPLLAGCASTPLTRAPVGPEALSRTVPAPEGFLQVFSATVKSPPMASDDAAEFNLHTGYEIQDASGKDVKFVPNHASNMDESPDRVKLTAGNYNLVAESSAYGRVTLPAAVEASKITVIHLQ